ncbi:E3 ubiquitin-protein ligase WAV3-like [Oryza glaberrima]|uniref:E3 ubiquitin-protein ligase WAV3-like n=1 Tax=Oryza glaberrima TaxID=4538 RepID=UPI00224C514C|nr:E3 ubiquitin-protein ligase WAV3-like [Oryza glaberrima]
MATTRVRCSACLHEFDLCVAGAGASVCPTCKRPWTNPPPAASSASSTLPFATSSFGNPPPAASSASSTLSFATFSSVNPPPAASSASNTLSFATSSFGNPPPAASSASNTLSFATSSFGNPPPAASSTLSCATSSFGNPTPAASSASSTLSFARSSSVNAPPQPGHGTTTSGLFGPSAPPPPWSSSATSLPRRPLTSCWPPEPSPVPVQTPPVAYPAQPSVFATPFRRVTEEGHAYDDDEPVESPPAQGGEPGGGEAAANDGGLVVIKTHCEFPAIARSTPRDNFAVLLHVKAPSIAGEAAARAPVDLVTVLDVSGSMEGYKLTLLKRAMGFVIDKLGPGDRLAIVSFSYNARRVIRLTRMSEGGKASAKSAVESLHADGCTNILKGLVEAAKVFDGRRYRNAVASVILLSDGQDNYNVNGGWGASNSKNYSVLVPPSFKRSGDRRLPVHTFGFGTDHDAAAMHAIAEETGGTFSFIENQAVVQDAFAQCIGGLLSVTVQEARIAIACPHAAVRVRSVNSGRYDSVVDGDGRAASVDVGELYADEERRFLVFVDVPAAGAGEDATELIKVSCTYRDTASRQSMAVAGEDAVVQRPAEVSTSTEPSMEVERERFRVEATEDIAAAREAAERGAYASAKAILDRRQEALARSARRLAGDARCAALVSELRELSARVANRREYELTGRACMLAGMSSHAQQRATSVQLFSSAAELSSGAVPFGYSTPAMQSMVESSRKSRESGSGGN